MVHHHHRDKSYKTYAAYAQPGVCKQRVKECARNRFKTDKRSAQRCVYATRRWRRRVPMPPSAFICGESVESPATPVRAIRVAASAPCYEMQSGR